MEKYELLIIDDEPDLIKMTTFVLENAGYEVYSATDGKTGLKKFEEVKPDLILLDIIMPDMDGFEVLYILRNNYPEIQQVPVVILTVKKDIESGFQARGFGATEYIVKPVDPKELIDKIEKELSKHNQRD